MERCLLGWRKRDSEFPSGLPRGPRPPPTRPFSVRCYGRPCHMYRRGSERGLVTVGRGGRYAFHDGFAAEETAAELSSARPGLRPGPTQANPEELNKRGALGRWEEGREREIANLCDRRRGRGPRRRDNRCERRLPWWRAIRWRSSLRQERREAIW